MRLKPFDQFIVILFMLALIVLAVFVGALCWMPGFESGTMSVLHFIFETGPIINRIIVTAVAVLIVFLCVRVIFVRKKREARPTPDVVQEGIMLRSGENGSSFITIKAIDAMVKKYIRGNQKVRDCKVSVQPVDDQQNLLLRLQVVLLPDINIPDTCTEIQDSLASYIQNMTGIMVREVRVSVDDSTEPVAVKQRTVK